MDRKFNVKAGLAPQFPAVEPATIRGGFSFGHFDAAEVFAAKFLPNYQVIPGGEHYNAVRRFEAINHNLGFGAVLWVEEVGE